jgi:hypothetical protein
MRKIVVALAALAALPAFAQNDISTRYANTITPDALKEKLSVIASAQMEGRETASPGQKRAAAFIETNFKRFGLLPGTTAGYQQHFAVYQDTLMDVSLKVNGKTFPYGETYSVNVGTVPNGLQTIKEVIYIGKGDTITQDVKGKWVLVDFSDLVGFRGLRPRTMRLATAGIKGYISISKNFPAQVRSLKGSMYIKKPTSTNVPSITVSYAVASAILNQPVASSDDLSKITKGAVATNINFNIYKRPMLLESSNVVGVMPGTDKKDEYVFLTGHYDHLGKRGDVIYYGADDDGSGTASVLQMAEAFAKAKAEGHGPRRTIVFMTVSGEEEGLLGSEFYSEHPLFPLEKTSVDLNTDMVGRIDSARKSADTNNYVYVIGDDRLSSDLVKITDSVNKRFSTLQLDRRFNGNDPERFYFRSDHFNFARKGVPIIFYFDGTHADYHRPTDTVDKINFDLMSKRVKLIFQTAWIAANRDEMLKRDIPLR